MHILTSSIISSVQNRFPKLNKATDLISPPLQRTKAFSITVHLACSRAIRLTRF